MIMWSSLKAREDCLIDFIFKVAWRGSTSRSKTTTAEKDYTGSRTTQCFVSCRSDLYENEKGLKITQVT